MYTASSNYKCALRFFQNCQEKKRKHNNHFLRRPKSLKKTISGNFWTKIKMYIKSSNYKCALHFLQKCLGKNLRDLLQFLKLY